MKPLPALLLAFACSIHSSLPAETLTHLDGLAFHSIDKRHAHFNIIDITSKEMADKTGLDIFPAFYAAFTVLPLSPSQRTELRLDGKTIFSYERCEEGLRFNGKLDESGHHVQILLKKGTIEVLFHKIEYPANSGTYALRDLTIIPHIFHMDNPKEMAVFRKLFLANNEIVGLNIDYGEKALTILADLRMLAEQCPQTRFTMPIEAGDFIPAEPGNGTLPFPSMDSRVSEMGISTFQELDAYNRMHRNIAAKVYGSNVSEARAKIFQKYKDTREKLQK